MLTDDEIILAVLQSSQDDWDLDSDEIVQADAVPQAAISEGSYTK